MKGIKHVRGWPGANSRISDCQGSEGGQKKKYVLADVGITAVSDKNRSNKLK
mgnify:CR=1 FL=1